MSRNETYVIDQEQGVYAEVVHARDERHPDAEDNAATIYVKHARDGVLLGGVSIRGDNQLHRLLLVIMRAMNKIPAPVTLEPDAK